MSRLPSIRNLTNVIRTLKVKGARVGKSADYLVQGRATLQQYSDLEHLALSTDAACAPPGTTDAAIKEAKALGYHITIVRASLAQELWARQFFIDADVLEQLLFINSRDPNVSDPIFSTLAWIRDARVNQPGVLIFPVHSLGIRGAGLVLPIFGQLAFVNRDHGYALSPQTNDLQRTVSFVQDVASAFRIRKAIPIDLLQHWRTSRPTGWLERNPLLVMRTVQLPGSYYGNEWLLISRLQATCGALAMLAALQPPPQETSGAFLSTRTTNNWQTLDIHHYITLFDNPRRPSHLDGQCIPLHAGRLELSELADLDIDIAPHHWHRHSATAKRVHAAIELVYSHFLRGRVSVQKLQETAHTRTYRKLFSAIGFFRRSFGNSSNDWRAKVSLATAFEMLLTDSYAGGISQTLKRRVRLLLIGVSGTRAMQRSVVQLYESRSALVHRGSNDEADLPTARKAFALCFVALTEKMGSLSKDSSTPMRDLTGDAP